ncbi:VOC family protein [Microbacterium luticocti]|uniref:VOC family protein n=1 Tax=Microbacterium luticocti TaxID=451764 RepID=UPI0004114563|nr:VOC family protein [Microbacterium luticocti]
MAEFWFDHVGVQVRDLEAAASALETLFGYRRATRPVTNTRHGVRGMFLEKPGAMPIKLITPVDPERADGRYGTHHLAFRTDDIDAAVAALRQGGARLLSPPQPGEMFDDEPIAFLYAAGTNVELVTTRDWRDRVGADED